MKAKLLQWLVCPDCGGTLQQTVFSEKGDEVVDGLLKCPSGHVYPITRAIPRMITDAFALFPEFSRRYADRLPAALPRHASTGRHADAIRRTRESFGYQWSLFSQMVIDFRENFLGYVRPIDQSFFPGKLGIDVGCGFGRHIYNAALFGAEMVGVDLSVAIDVTRRNTRHLPNVHLVQADIYHLPFRHGVFDFAYSIGVLHHLPEPETGFRCLLPLIKPGGTVLIWVYSTSRSVMNRLLECVRWVTTRLPQRMQKMVAFAAALIDWVAWIRPYQIGSSLPIVGPLVKKVAFPRMKTYSGYPFQVVWADWFDRLAAPIRFYYNKQDLEGWLSRAGLVQPIVGPTGLYGWRALGRVAAQGSQDEVQEPQDRFRGAGEPRRRPAPEAVLRILVLAPYLHDTVPGQRFRIEQWARVLEPEGVRFLFMPFETEGLRRVWHANGKYAVKAAELARAIRRRVATVRTIGSEWDAILLLRELMPIGPAVLERVLARRSIPLIYDFDDAIFLPDVSDVNRRFQWLKWPKKTGAICRMSTHVIVGNEYLREYALRYTDPHDHRHRSLFDENVQCDRRGAGDRLERKPDHLEAFAGP
jgi:SAM-dependent methyltransferase/uncharacterized protein YbaR (Trm112 family)